MPKKSSFSCFIEQNSIKNGLWNKLNYLNISFIKCMQLQIIVFFSFLKHTFLIQLFSLIMNILLFFRFDKVFMQRNTKFWRGINTRKKSLLMEKQCAILYHFSFRSRQYDFQISDMSLSDIFPKSYRYHVESP